MNPLSSRFIIFFFLISSTCIFLEFISKKYYYTLFFYKIIDFMSLRAINEAFSTYQISNGYFKYADNASTSFPKQN